MSSGTASAIRAELRQALRGRPGEQGDRIHGAYLFEGEPGTGRRASAFWFARELLGRDAPEPEDAADQASFDHPDLHLVERDGPRILIAQIRELQQKLALRAHQGGRRVALIFDADRILPQAANALLKTLEEPGAGTTIVLVCTSGESLLPTIRSRVTRLRFAREPEQAIATALEQDGFAPEDAWLASTLGGGSQAAAREWAEQSLDHARELLETLESSLGQPAAHAVEQAESFRGGEPARLRTELLLDVHAVWARRHAEAQVQSNGALLATWLGRFEAGEIARRELRRRSLNPQLVAEGLFLGLEKR